MAKEKTIEFENINLNSPHFKKDFTYIDLCIFCFNTPPKPGISINQMIDRIDAAKFYRASKGKAKININIKQLNELLAVFPDNWHIVDEQVVEFYKYIKNLKEHF